MAQQIPLAIIGAVVDSTDTSKQFSIDLSGATTGTSTTFQISHTANRVLTFPNATTAIVGTDTAQTLTNKTIDASVNTVSNVSASNITAGSISNASLTNPSATITAGSGLAGGGVLTLGGSISLSIPASGVTNSMLNNSSLTVTAGTGLSGGGSIALGGSTTINLADTTVAAGTYGSATQSPVIAIDAQGRITSATNTGITVGKLIPLFTQTQAAVFTLLNGGSLFGGTGMGSATIPANTLAVGDNIYIRANGNAVNTSGATRIASFSLITGTIIVTTNTLSIVNNSTGYMELEAHLTIVTGPSIVGQLSVTLHTSATAISVAYSPAANVINIVLSNAITIGVLATIVSTAGFNLRNVNMYIVKGS